MTDGTPLVSILTPTYNHADFIAPCIESVLAQTYANWEQIIIDDGSTDETAKAVSRYPDARVRYERQDHVGILRLAETYNRALAMARGTLIAILEGDDFWEPHKLALLVPRFADPEVVLAYGRTAVFLDGRGARDTIPSPRFERRSGPAILTNMPIGTATRAMLRGDVGIFTLPCAVVLRRDALQGIGGFSSAPGLGSTDYPTFLTLSLRGRFAYVGEVVAWWRRHSASASWLHYEGIIHAHSFAAAFAGRHKSALGLNVPELEAIHRSWRRPLRRTAFHVGRRLLLERRWAEARASFGRAVDTEDPALLIGAAAGWLASWLHRDLEVLLRLLGRAHFERRRG